MGDSDHEVCHRYDRMVKKWQSRWNYFVRMTNRWKIPETVEHYIRAAASFNIISEIQFIYPVYLAIYRNIYHSVQRFLEPSFDSSYPFTLYLHRRGTSPAAMKSSTAALLLASIGSLTSASPVKSRQTTEPSAFTIVAARSESPIHLQTVQASGQAFWIGKETTTYCPPEVDAEGNCPPGTHTVFEGGESTLSLVSHIFPSCRNPRPCPFFHILVLRLASQERTIQGLTHPYETVNSLRSVL